MESIKHLIELYEINALRYQELLVDLAKFLNEWNDQTGNSPKELDSEQNLNQGQGGEFEEDSTDFIMNYMERRNQLFAELQQREAEIAHCQAQICSACGISEFSIEKISPHIPEQLIASLQQPLNKILSYMQEVNKYDKQLMAILQNELQATKLEMHRLRSGQKVRQAYEQTNTTEAYFIDQNK